MTVAFVLMSVKSGSDRDIMEKLSVIKEVEASYEIYGVYDIITKIRARSVEELKEIVMNRIRKLEDVHTTLTLMVIE
ncbi:MAG: Lrp/AsnC ligand binding domain-containing protein [Nitrososphaerales archaeon]|nr:Lrp/AsnC ligand binding domain-containing protein [Nitrososphaerales archaeon]